MIFMHTWQAVIEARKTQTARLVKPGDRLVSESYRLPAVYNQSRLVYHVGRDYAVQPGRGKAAVARIRITDLWQQDIRQYTVDDSDCEGFSSLPRFWDTWLGMHSPKTLQTITKWFMNRNAPLSEAEAIGGYRMHMDQDPKERYDAWVIQFCLEQTVKSE